MNLQIIATRDFRQDLLNAQLQESLPQELIDRGSVDVVDKHPDIVHLFGLWNRESIKAIREFRVRRIPIVFTSLDGLPAINATAKSLSGQNVINACVKKISLESDVVHVCGSVEETAIRNLCKEAKTVCIKNCFYTRLTTKPSMLQALENLYASVVEKHDEKVSQTITNRVKEANINDKAIASVISRLLLLHTLYIKGSIPKTFLDDLSALLVATDYDEKHLCSVLRRLKLYKFASRAMQVLADCSTLTEGFMPMPPTDDKLTAGIKQNVIK